MALNIYHEARGEDTLGQYLVADVTLNRVADKRWPNTICKVVNQPWQFYWTMSKTKVKDYAALQKAMILD